MASHDRVLEALRKMSERDLHTQVILPLLTNMKFQYIHYVHGSFERGKDILYLSNDSYGDQRLEVCQVKNDSFTGRAASSSSAVAVLTQLKQCKLTRALNPGTNKLELPKAVVLMTTYPVPDRTVAGADEFLVELDRLECKIIAPERLVSLIEKFLPEFYFSVALPGESTIDALSKYVSVHREARAFRIPAPRPIAQWCVNLGVSDSRDTLQRIARDITQSCGS